MTMVEVAAGQWVHDPGYGGTYEVDEYVPATTAARQYFENTGVVVSPTADAQRWQVPGTEHSLTAVEARQISLDVREALGRVAL